MTRPLTLFKASLNTLRLKARQELASEERSHFWGDSEDLSMSEDGALAAIC